MSNVPPFFTLSPDMFDEFVTNDHAKRPTQCTCGKGKASSRPPACRLRLEIELRRGCLLGTGSLNIILVHLVVRKQKLKPQKKIKQERMTLNSKYQSVFVF